LLTNQQEGEKEEEVTLFPAASSLFRLHFFPFLEQSKRIFLPQSDFTRF